MIDTQTTVNPLETPMAKPSEIVRQWPDAMWETKKAKWVFPDGRIAFCAIGILAETGGFEWGEPDWSMGLYHVWHGNLQSRAGRFVGEKYRLSATEMVLVYDANDADGKAAAADQLERMGL